MSQLVSEAGKSRRLFTAPPLLCSGPRGVEECPPTLERAINSTLASSYNTNVVWRCPESCLIWVPVARPADVEQTITPPPFGLLYTCTVPFLNSFWVSWNFRFPLLLFTKAAFTFTLS